MTSIMNNREGWTVSNNSTHHHQHHTVQPGAVFEAFATQITKNSDNNEGPVEVKFECNEDHHLTSTSKFSYLPQNQWEEIARGSFGIVYSTQLLLGEDLSVEVAIKRIPIMKFQFSELRRMQLLRSRSNHVVTLIDYWQDSWYAYLVLEKLEEVFDSHAKLIAPNISIEQVLRQVLIGLQECHSAGIIHGDLKPSNIMINSRGVVKLIDWDDTAYDPQYAKSADPSSRRKVRERDLWAFAISAYLVLVGYLPNLSKPFYPAKLSPQTADFLKLCFDAADHSDKAYHVLLNHPFLSKMD
jgi:serine/threonine protein kinase